MPNIKSAKKRVKVTATKTLRNQMIKSALKSSIRKYRAEKWAVYFYEFRGCCCGSNGGYGYNGAGKCRVCFCPR